MLPGTYIQASARGCLSWKGHPKALRRSGFTSLLGLGTRAGDFAHSELERTGLMQKPGGCGGDLLCPCVLGEPFTYKTVMKVTGSRLELRQMRFPQPKDNNGNPGALPGLLLRQIISILGSVFMRCHGVPVVLRDFYTAANPSCSNQGINSCEQDRFTSAGTVAKQFTELPWD